MTGLLANPWVILAVVVGLAVSHGAVFYKGHSYGAAGVELRVAREVAAERLRQQNAAAAALEEAEKAAEAAEAENQEIQGRVAVLLAELGARKDQCVLGDEDARRLDAIR